MLDFTNQFDDLDALIKDREAEINETTDEPQPCESLLDALEALPRADIDNFDFLFDGFNQANNRLASEYEKKTAIIRDGDVHIEEEIELKDRRPKTHDERETELDFMPFYKQELRTFALKIKRFVEGRNITGGAVLRRYVERAVDKSEFSKDTESARTICRVSPNRSVEFYHGDVSSNDEDGVFSDDELLARGRSLMKADLEMIVKKVMVWVE